MLDLRRTGRQLGDMRLPTSRDEYQQCHDGSDRRLSDPSSKSVLTRMALTIVWQHGRALEVSETALATMTARQELTGYRPSPDVVPRHV